VSLTITCDSGSGGGTIDVPISDRTYDVAKDANGWIPADDLQGSATLPDLCNGGRMRVGSATFVSGILSSTPVRLNYRWHYGVNGKAGGWSATYTVTPDPLP
jgi:hypothetical protein